MVAQVFHYYAGAVDKHYGETIPVAGGVDMTFREPLGVVGLIVPWNFPLNIASWKLGPALACGNTVVLKPAELTPLTAMRLGELALEAGFPEGVVNVVVGKGSVVGQRLIAHPDVAKIGFTGSTEVGQQVMRGAAGTVKRVTLELGGKSANVVFADADLEKAAAAAPYAVFDNAGQDCCARSRILVERSVYDRFAELLVEATRNVRVGDPEDDATEMGPLVSAAHRETVASFVEETTLFQGEVPDGPGFWFPCTLVEASNDDRVAREEVFGPVAALIPFADEAEAVAIANDTPYGLSGSIWTRDGARALRVARALETGVLSVNSNSSVRVSTPFGGFKQSGFGRELGMQALQGYSEVKNVFISTEEWRGPGHVRRRRSRSHGARRLLAGGANQASPERSDMGRLDGKVCVITGAAGGIGREAAKLFSDEGATVCVADVSAETGEPAAAECRDAFFLPVDVSDAVSVEALYAAVAERCGGIDVLYNNAGIMPPDDDSILDDRARRLGPRPGGEREGRLPLLQVRDPAPARARRRLGDQRRLVRRAGRRGHVADLLHRVEGRRALDVARALGAVRAPGRARERAVPRAGRDAAPDAALQRRPGRVRAPADPPADGPPRAGARDRQRCALPRLRRVELRERLDLPRRRRPHRRLRHARGLGSLSAPAL